MIASFTAFEEVNSDRFFDMITSNTNNSNFKLLLADHLGPDLSEAREKNHGQLMSFSCLVVMLSKCGNLLFNIRHLTTVKIQNNPNLG